MTTLRELQHSVNLVAHLRPDLLDTEVYSDDDPFIFIGLCHVATYTTAPYGDQGPPAGEVVVV